MKDFTFFLTLWNLFWENSSAVQWLGLHTSTAGNMDSVSGWGIFCLLCGMAKKKKKRKKSLFFSYTLAHLNSG